MNHANPLDTDTNHSTLIKAISWLAVVTSVFFLSLRMGMKWTNTKSLGLDDFAIVLALLFSIAASVCLTIAASEGYGNRDIVPDTETLTLIQKLVFTFNVLFFLSLGSSMLSITDLIFHISPVSRHRYVALATGVGIIIWMAIAIFGFAFQCRPSAVNLFTSGECINREAFCTFIAMFNLCLELSLVLQPTILTWALNMPISRRITVVTCFLGRLLVVVLLIAHITVIWHHDISQNILSESGFVLTTILIMNTSIVAACTPYLRPFFISLHTSQLDITELPHLKTIQHSSSAHDSSSITSSGVRSTPRSPMYSSGGRSKRTSRIWQSNAQDLVSNKDWKFERLDPNTVAGRLRPDDTGKRSTTITTCQVPDKEQDSMGTIGHTVEFTVEVEMIPKS